jgi:replicative DNA helicase
MADQLEDPERREDREREERGEDRRGRRASGQVIDLTSQLRRVPRHDLQAEIAVLGSVLLDPVEAWPLIADILVADDFYHPAHSEIWRAFMALVETGTAINIVSLAEMLRVMERLNTIGGTQYLSDLTDAIPTIAHVVTYAQIVADYAAIRAIQNKAREIWEHGYDESYDVHQYRSNAIELSALTEQRNASQLVPFEQAILDAYKAMEDAAARGTRTMGMQTGFRLLDKLTTGMQAGELWILGARPAMGKTAFSWNLALAGAMEQARLPRPKPLLYFSLEMPRQELVLRAGASEGRVDLARIRGNMMSADDMRDFTAALSRTFKAPILIDDSGETTYVELVAKVKRQIRKTGVSAVVVDYLQLMKYCRGVAYESREREVSDISRGLKLLAKACGIPVLALAQLNRDAEKRPASSRRPQLSDLRESGAIEQDADVVLFIYRDEVYNKDSDDKGIAEVIVAKQRNGPPDTVRLRFVPSQVRFDNLFVEDEPAAPVQLPFAPDPSPPPAAAPTEPVEADWRNFE